MMTLRILCTFMCSFVFMFVEPNTSWGWWREESGCQLLSNRDVYIIRQGNDIQPKKLGNSSYLSNPPLSWIELMSWFLLHECVLRRNMIPDLLLPSNITPILELLCSSKALVEAGVGHDKQHNYESITNRILLRLCTQAISRERPTRQRGWRSCAAQKEERKKKEKT
ncbi:hypothetical protein F4818DRAFT_409448 [Hypoxylon cercidicola]|nr:hypothetical protein F4818DRAFT_409448 [Hypoxylon cercidicola]